jgi:chromate transporter
MDLARNAPGAPRAGLGEIFWIFFRIACTSFGGFMAMISVVENVVVERRRLLTHQEMLDGISLASLLPGPVAVNVCAYTGWRLRGGPGALVAAFAAILPAFVLIVALAYVYFRWGGIPAVTRIFQGFVPAVAAIIVAAAWNMGKKSVTGMREAAIGVAAFGVLIGVGGFYSTLGIIAAGGVLGWLLFRGDAKPSSGGGAAETTAPARGVRPGPGANLFLLAGPAAGGVPFFAFEPTVLGTLIMVFGGMSVMLFGGGYVFIPLIQEIVVDTHRWVTTREFVDGIALGQVTPGPILVSAAFIGYKVAGLAGATVATVAIFTPPAVIMVAAAHALERIKGSRVIGAALKGIRPAVVGMIFAAAVIVGQTAQPVWISVAIFAVALYTLVRMRIEAVWIIPSAGALGWLLY